MEKENLLDEYRKLQPLYEEFSDTVKTIIENLLNEHEFKYQKIEARVKTEKSVKRKLNKLRKLKSIKTICDLAGNRIIFYLTDDSDRFIFYLKEKFEVIQDDLKYSNDDYNAYHLVVRFGKDEEYKKFDGLKCEIQLTTVLYHAWSELAHDIIYEPEQDLLEFDKYTFDLLQEQFAGLMKNHIQQAQIHFDYLSKQFEDLKQGKKYLILRF